MYGHQRQEEYCRHIVDMITRWKQLMINWDFALNIKSLEILESKLNLRKCSVLSRNLIIPFIYWTTPRMKYYGYLIFVYFKNVLKTDQVL